MDLRDVSNYVAFVKQAYAYDPIPVKVTFVKKALTSLATGNAVAKAAPIVGKAGKLGLSAAKFGLKAAPVLGGVMQGVDTLSETYNTGSQLMHGNIGNALSNAGSTIAKGTGTVLNFIPGAGWLGQLGAMGAGEYLDTGAYKPNPVAATPGARHNTPTGLVDYNPMK